MLAVCHLLYCGYITCNIYMRPGLTDNIEDEFQRQASQGRDQMAFIFSLIASLEIRQWHSSQFYWLKQLQIYLQIQREGTKLLPPAGRVLTSH